MARADVKVTTDLDSSKMQASMTRLRGGISNMVKSATGKFLALGATIAGLRGLGGLGKLAMEAEEVDSKFNAVFKDSAPKMLRVIEDLKKHIHLTTTEMKESLATYGAMADGMGLTEEAGLIFSESMVKLQGDLASFHDLNTEEAFNKIKSAISGEFEPLKQLGIVLNQAKVKQEALNLGIYDGTTALTTSQKAIAVQSLLVALMGDAVGDAEATTNSSMNAYKRLNRELKELAEGIGEFVVPAVNGLVSLVSGMVNSFKSMNRASKNSKSEFHDLARENLVLNGVLHKTIGGYIMTQKTLTETNSKFQNSKVITQLVADEIERLTKVQEELNDKQADNNATEEADEIRISALKEQKTLLQQIIDEMGTLFEEGQDELRQSELKIKNAKALLQLEEQRRKAMGKADVNKSGVTTGREKRDEERRQRQIESQRREVRRREVALEQEGGEDKADSGTLDAFNEARDKLTRMELGDMAREKNLTGEVGGSSNKLTPKVLEDSTDPLNQSKKGGGANRAEEGKNEKLVEVLEQIKELNESTDTNIGDIKDLMDKIDGALT